MKYDSNKKIVSKIKGLLAIARDAKNDSESQSAFLMAQKLMVKYHVKDENLESSQKVVYRVIESGLRIENYKKLLNAIIADNFKAIAEYQINSLGTSLLVFGYEKDVELCEKMYKEALSIMLYREKKFVNDFYISKGLIRKRSITCSLKYSYLAGFLNGLKDRFDDQIKNESNGNKSFALAVQVDENVKRAFMKNNKIEKVKVGIKKDNPTAFFEGHKDGYSTNLGAEKVETY